MKLNEKYNPESFVNFIQDFLPEDFKLREEDIVINKDRYKEITKAKILGFCESLDLHVLEMDHTHDKDPRVAIATDAFKILADHWIHRALVIFKSNDSDNYRFSYLTITLDLNDKNKVIKKYSNARRYSFYLGSSAKVRTPEQQLIKKGKIKDVDDLLNRFSVEVVNKQFYLEVAKFFDELVSIEDQNLILPGVSETDINTRKSFAVRLIGRAMFCWFLKQKKSDNGQLVPDEILSSKVVSDNYYHNVLEPLFFGVLNTSIDARDIRTELFDKVPYLNGGLFNPQTDDYYELDRGTFASKYINTLKISDKWFKEFFELLETYNFTIDENTVFDQELSVDPEMLGRIFENLLAEINPETGSSERKRTGSFYTPRQIVEYMVDQSLIEYFKTKTDIEDKKLNALVSYDLTDDTEYPLEQKEKEQIINAIESLKILDPACGSGAYPIGALQKIVYILQQVDPECTLWLDKKLQGVPDLYKQKIINEVKQNPFDYTRKLDVIKNSIFGVDIQPIAVDVSRLRCFLTLVVESEIDDNKPNRGIEPLPNLDFKFVCANSLVPAPEQEKTQDHSLFGDEFQDKLSVAVDAYFSSSGENKRNANNEIHKLIDNKVREKLAHLTGLVSYNGDKKMEDILAKMNKKQIDKHSRILILWSSYKNIFTNKPVDFFDPHYFFPSVKNGFDIIIANPPYVSINQISKNKDSFTSYLKSGDASLGNYLGINLHSTPMSRKKYPPKPNLYAFFFVMAKKLCTSNGIISFIVPKGVLTAKDLDTLRYLFLSKMQLFLLTSFKEGVFNHSETSSGKIATSSLLVFLKNTTIDSNHKINISNVTIGELGNDVSSKIDSNILLENIDNWNLISMSAEQLSILAKYNKGKDLSIYYNHESERESIHKFYFDVGFTLDKNKIIKEEPINHSEYYRLFEFKGIKTYRLETKDYYPKNKNYIALTKNSQGYIVLDQQYKIIWSVKNPSAFGFTDEEVIFPMGKAAIIASNDKNEILFLLSILNSKITWFILTILLKHEGEKDMLVPISSIKNYIRIPDIKKEQKNEIIKISNEITQYKIKNDEKMSVELEKKIDDLILDYFGYTEAEKEIIRSSN